MFTCLQTPLRTLSLIALASTIAICAVACAPETEESPDTVSDTISETSNVLDRRLFEAQQYKSPKALDKVDNGDGTWSYGLPENFEPDTLIKGKIITWYYAGQARYSHDPTSSSSMRYFVAKEEPKLTPKEQLLDMKRIDALGRIWKVANVDTVAWAKHTAPGVDELEEENLRLNTKEIEVDRQLIDDVEPGTVIPWKPSSWSDHDCDGSSDSYDDVHIWDGEGRWAISPSYSKRTKAMVRLSLPGNGVCSGVILTSNNILTAAHCVSDDNDNPISNSSVSVCLATDQTDCRTAIDIDFPSSYHGGSSDGGGTDFSDDWAIVELGGSWSGSPTDMDLSQASNSVLRDLTNVKNMGYPGYAPTCNNANASTLYFNAESEPISTIYTKSIRMKIDGGGGHSGGPLYYCPANNNNLCETTTEKGYVIGVWAGWSGTFNKHVGPKAANFRDAAIAFLYD